MLISASHTHAGLEGYSLDRRNVAKNPNIGIFSEPALNFVTDRLAKALREADAALQPQVTASFYGQGLGQLLLDHAKALGLAAAAKH